MTITGRRTRADRPSNATTMRAAVLVSPGVMETREVPIPQPDANEVRVRLEGCGVCASNIPPWEGREWFRYPMAPGSLGHEAWGRVDAIGKDVLHLAVGDRVAMLSDKAYAEYDTANEDKVVLLPDALGDQPFPAEPLGCAMNIFSRSGIRAGQTVAIIGIGFLGALLTRLAADANARVIGISRRAFALDVARRMGAHQTIPMDDHCRIIEQVRQFTGGQFCEVVIEAVGKQWPLDLAAELTRERGRMVVAGYHQDGLRQCNLQLWNWRGIDVINAHERDPKVYLAGMRAAVDAVAGGRMDPAPLYTHAYPLDRLGEALDATRDRPDGFLKALVMM
ncbi:MAG TPA: zinc-binding dehydrogenase [Tepidisphaeraceae bacterium]|nr:zinc-binding dehydrogenase [Tepidisphaeraceae bacterium]